MSLWHGSRFLFNFPRNPQMRPSEARRTLSMKESLTHAYNVTDKALHSKVILISRVILIANLTGILLLLSVVLGSRRRHSKSASMKAVLFASYTMTAYLIAYAMSLMLHPDASVDGQGYGILWAMLLVIAFGSADSFCAYSLVDNEQWRRYNWQSALKVWILLSLFYPYYRNPYVIAIILFFFIAVLLKLSSKNLSLAASSRYALEKSSKLLLDYMKMEEKAVDIREVDPVSMKGYRYLVQGEELLETKGFTGNDQVVTLEKVWSCDGKLLSSNHGGDLLKDLCLSFSFFKILRLRYAGYKLPWEVHMKMVQLIRRGLLEREGDDYHERVFRVVEDELAFLFDSFYTKFHQIFQPKRYRIRKAEGLLVAVLSSYAILSLLYFAIDPSDLGEVNALSLWQKLYLYSAMMCLMTFLLVEITQVCLLRYTRWAKVVNVCEYVNHHDSWQKNKRKEKRVGKICSLRSSQPWERKLHQYSLLEGYSYRPCKLLSNKFMSMFINWATDGKKKCRPIGLSGEVKKAVLDLVKDTYDTRLENGLASLRRHNVMGVLSWACKLETQSEVIMVWHIATAMCEGQSSELDSEESRRNVRVATSLSNYLAYLVGFAPRLLPNHPYMTESLFDQMITDASHLFKGCKTVRQRINKLRESPRGSGKDSNTLDRGAALGNCLLDEKGEPNLIWAILADFWVETMLYVAPSTEVTAHVEELANGGEFVTHLWALLYHLGIKREKRSRRSCQDVTITVDDATSEPVMPSEERDFRRCSSA